MKVVNFYRAMLRRARLCHSTSSVCLSVCLSACMSVTFRYRGWNTSKIITRLISLRFTLELIPTWAIWSNRNTPEISVEWGVGHEYKNLQYLWNGARYDQGYYDGLIGSRSGDAQTFPSKFLTLKAHITQSLVGFSVISHNVWPCMTSKRDWRCFGLALAPDAAASTRKVAVFSVH